MALNLTPCVYPLIPITVSYFGGRSGRGKGRLIGHGVCYVGGLAVANSTLGVLAALTGSLMGVLLQNPAVLVLIAAVLSAFAASLFGFWQMRLPSGFAGASARPYTGYFGSAFMGLTLGVVAAPCIGPFVLGLLTWVASMGSPYKGFLVFFTLSIGLGLPLLFLAVFSGKLAKLPRSGEWMVWIRKLMGWVLVGMSAYFIRPLLPQTAGIMVLAGVILAAGLHLCWIDHTQATFRAFDWMKAGSGIIGLVVATYMAGSSIMQGPGVDWQAYSDKLLVEAAEEGRPVIIGFSADWCAPWRELDEVTFHDREVVNQVEQDFTMVKVDLTRRGSSDDERLLQRFGVKGVPTVVFLDSRGRERHDLRMAEFLPPGQFLVRLAEARKRPAH